MPSAPCGPAKEWGARAQLMRHAKPNDITIIEITLAQQRRADFWRTTSLPSALIREPRDIFEYGGSAELSFEDSLSSIVLANMLSDRSNSRENMKLPGRVTDSIVNLGSPRVACSYV